MTRTEYELVLRAFRYGCIFGLSFAATLVWLWGTP